MDEDYYKITGHYNYFKSTGYYAVVHYGENGDQNLPLFLKTDTECEFTANMKKVECFTSIDSALAAADKATLALRKMGHPLADRIKVVKLFCRDICRDFL